MHLLVVGGAGYIGSHMVKLLSSSGCEITTLDNLSTGHRDAVIAGEFVEADLADRRALDRLFEQNDFNAVLHFAAFIDVAESVQKPDAYLLNNFEGSRNLLDAMVAHDVDRLVFSSTAAIFGEPRYTPIDEAHPKKPINPYGVSKLKVEQALEQYAAEFGLKSVSLRYFNAAGADPEGRLGERHDPETHLIPLVLQAASGRRDSIAVYGQDYETPDGTCIRDYIHIQDLCDAHLLALEYLENNDASAQFNIGNGQGFSVSEVIETARAVTGRDIPVRYEQRREGDPAILVADSARARAELGWRPRYSSLEQIIATAWNWERSFFLQ